MQPGPGPAGDRPAPRRTCAGQPGRDRTGRPGLRSGSRTLGAAPCGGRPLQRALPPGQVIAIQRAQRVHLRRRPRVAHPGGGGAGRSEPGPLPARTTPPTRSCSTSSSSSPRSPSCSRGRPATTSASTSSAGRSPAGASRPCCSPTHAIRPARSSRARSWRAGWRWRASWAARC